MDLQDTLTKVNFKTSLEFEAGLHGKTEIRKEKREKEKVV